MHGDQVSAPWDAMSSWSFNVFHVNKPCNRWTSRQALNDRAMTLRTCHWPKEPKVPRGSRTDTGAAIGTVYCFSWTTHAAILFGFVDFEPLFYQGSCILGLWPPVGHLARLAAEVATDLEETYLAAEPSGDESLAGGFGQRRGSRVKRVKRVCMHSVWLMHSCVCVI